MEKSKAEQTKDKFDFDNLVNRVAKAAGHYLCEDTNEELYNAYLSLKEAQHNGHNYSLAADYATVWQPLEGKCVNVIVELIENELDNSDNKNSQLPLPEFMLGIDWELLKKQKATLLGVIEYLKRMKVPLTDDLEGILELIDSIQDAAVDIYGVEENLVFETYEKDDDGNCLYCGRKCWDGELCDEQQAGGFNND
jgi:hypothetical protein